MCFDMRDLLARFCELKPMDFMSYLRPAEVKQTRSYLIMKKVIDGNRLAFVYRKNVKLFYFDEKLAMSCPVENGKLAA